MIRCVGAALRGDGNPPEVPVIRTVLRAYNGVWGVPIKHMSAALCAHKCRACPPNLVGEPVIQPRRPNSRLDKVRHMFSKIP